MTEATGGPRSPRALAHDPPVRKVESACPVAETGADLLRRLEDEGGWDDEAWARILRHAGILIDGHRLDPDRPPRMVAAGARVVVYGFEREPRPVRLGSDAILLEAEGIVAVNKPPWFTVQSSRASILCSLERALREITGCPTLVPVHRLDRETSGVVVFAADRAAAGQLGKQFMRRKVGKEYLAVVSPPPVVGDWQVTGRLVRVAHPAHSLFELRADDHEEGRPSSSRFEFIERGKGERALIRCVPETGRTHQLRVHLAAGGQPIVGDSLYGRGYCAGEAWSAERLQLHASKLSFRLGGIDRELHAPPPEDFGLEVD